MKNRIVFLACFFLTTSLLYGDKPELRETDSGKKVLVLTPELKEYLNAEFPKHRILKDSDFNQKMLGYYYRNLLGVHPSVAWGDFNGDKKTDYALLLVTGDSPWGPLVEFIILNGTKKKKKFDIKVREEIYKYKSDYVRFFKGKLYKGRYQQNGWYIRWNKKEKSYQIIKS